MTVMRMMMSIPRKLMSVTAQGDDVRDSSAETARTNLLAGGLDAGVDSGVSMGVDPPDDGDLTFDKAVVVLSIVVCLYVSLVCLINDNRCCRRRGK